MGIRQCRKTEAKARVAIIDRQYSDNRRLGSSKPSLLNRPLILGMDLGLGLGQGSILIKVCGLELMYVCMYVYIYIYMYECMHV